VSVVKGESAIAAKLGVQISSTVLNLAMGAGAAIVASFHAGMFYAQWDVDEVPTTLRTYPALVWSIWPSGYGAILCH
jgi:hypothetical protein